MKHGLIRGLVTTIIVLQLVVCPGLVYSMDPASKRNWGRRPAERITYPRQKTEAHIILHVKNAEKIEMEPGVFCYYTANEGFDSVFIGCYKECSCSEAPVTRVSPSD